MNNFNYKKQENQFNKVFYEWAVYARNKNVGRKLKKVAAIAFLKNYMKKYLISLRKYGLI